MNEIVNVINAAAKLLCFLYLCKYSPLLWLECIVLNGICIICSCFLHHLCYVFKMDISLYISKAKNSHDILLRLSTETNPDLITGNTLVFFDEQNIVVWEFAKLLKL